MAIGTGLGSSVGVAPESTYGTYAAATRHLAGMFNVKHVQDTVEVSGVAAGRPMAPDEVVTQTQGTGQLSGQVVTRQMGLLLQHLLGSNSTPVQQGATTAYLQTHVLGDNVGKSLSVQNGVADTGGTVRPYTGLGGKITQGTFECGAGEALTCSFEFDFKEITEAQALVAPSYLTGLKPFHFAQSTVKLGTYGAEAAVSGVRKVSLTISRSQDTSRFYAGNAGKKDEPLWNDFVEVSGTIDIDYKTKADFVDRFLAHTSTALVWEFTGATIDGAHNEMFRIRLPKIYFSGDIPEVSGPGVNQASIPFKAFWDPTNGVVSAEYQSLDSAV